MKGLFARGTLLDHTKATVSAQIGSASLMSFPDGSIVSAELVKNEEIAELMAPKGLGGPGGVVPDTVKSFLGSEDDAWTLPVSYDVENTRKRSFASASATSLATSSS